MGILLTLGALIGIPNVRGTIVEYDGSITPTPPPKPPPSFQGKQNTTKWLGFMCTRKIRIIR